MWAQQPTQACGPNPRKCVTPVTRRKRVNQRRMDTSWWVENGRFYLRNGGFFANYVPN